MKCADCVCCIYDDGGFPHCSADPNWPAPCEYDDYEEPTDEHCWDERYIPSQFELNP